LIHGSIFFSRRVVRDWNSLQQRVLDATTVTSLTRHPITTRYGIKCFVCHAHNVKLKLIYARNGCGAHTTRVCAAGFSQSLDVGQSLSVLELVRRARVLMTTSCANCRCNYLLPRATLLPMHSSPALALSSPFSADADALLRC